MLKRVNGDHVRYVFPHSVVRRIMRSYLKTWWKPRFYRCDPVCCEYKQGEHRHFTWAILASNLFRLLFMGYSEYRWD